VNASDLHGHPPSARRPTPVFLEMPPPRLLGSQDFCAHQNFFSKTTRWVRTSRPQGYSPISKPQYDRYSSIWAIHGARVPGTSSLLALLGIVGLASEPSGRASPPAGSSPAKHEGMRPGAAGSRANVNQGGQTCRLRRSTTQTRRRLRCCLHSAAAPST